MVPMTGPATVARAKKGDAEWHKVEKVSAELLTLTYGAVVSQVLKDCDGNVEEANTQLEKMGYNIGLRLVEDFFAKTSIPRCKDFAETVDVIAKIALKMMLGVSGTVYTPASSSGSAVTECSIVLDENPLIEFVELPENYSRLCYCNIICGVIRGSLEMVHMGVECRFVQDILLGHPTNEIKVILRERLNDEKFSVNPGGD
ncbi:trafficking protein particle complex subunit 3 [Pelomyxa schiedti]|nr:trafficking protein particle complex subunit 3 [Pelomyxa schiedti]